MNVCYETCVHEVLQIKLIFLLVIHGIVRSFGLPLLRYEAEFWEYYYKKSDYGVELALAVGYR